MEPIDGRPVATLEVMRQVVERSPFTSWLGARVTVCEGGVAELEVPVNPGLTQHHGFVHGGVIGAIADNACAWAAASVAGDVVTLEYKVNLLAPAVGTRLVGRGRVLRASRRAVATASDVYAISEHGEQHVATMLATILPTGTVA